MSDGGWNPQLATERLLLAPLVPADAEELADLLNDQRLHRFTGGRPANIDELRGSFDLWAARVSPDGREQWLNWVIRERDTERPLGTLQATIPPADPKLVAEVAWVVAVGAQGQGYASEAASALTAFLFSKGVQEVGAHIHPDHEASARVARSIGMEPAVEWSHGERLWRLSRPSP